MLVLAILIAVLVNLGAKYHEQLRKLDLHFGSVRSQLCCLQSVNNNLW